MTTTSWEPQIDPTVATAEEIATMPFSLPVAPDMWRHDPDRTTRREAYPKRETTRVIMESWWDRFGPWTSTADINPYERSR